jgi:hypothetical protein
MGDCNGINFCIVNKNVANNNYIYIVHYLYCEIWDIGSSSEKIYCYFVGSYIEIWDPLYEEPCATQPAPLPTKNVEAGSIRENCKHSTTNFYRHVWVPTYVD